MLSIFKRSATPENDPYCGVMLGDSAMDTLTGFTGIVTARCEYLTGCNQVYILPNSEKTNEYKEGHWFDIERIRLVASGAVKIAPRHSGADTPPPKVDGPSL